MSKSKVESIVFDFDGLEPKRREDIVWNISGVAIAGDHIWTASDEYHSLQCFAPYRNGFRLKQSFNLKELVDLPEFDKPLLPIGAKEKKEADLEGLSYDGKYLWFCGSHCVSRPKKKTAGQPNDIEPPALRRNLLGRIELNADGFWSGIKGSVLPIAGKHTLRALLAENKMIAPYLDLPAKENGLDIEGIACAGRTVFLGLRGPVIGARAVILTLKIDRKFELVSVKPQFVDLAGLGIRDLHWDGRRMLVLAGPTLACDAPFYVLPKTNKPPAPLPKTWNPIGSQLPSGPEDHPEAIAILSRNGRRGFLMLSDGNKRADGLRYTADWYPLP